MRISPITVIYSGQQPRSATVFAVIARPASPNSSCARPPAATTRCWTKRGGSSSRYCRGLQRAGRNPENVAPRPSPDSGSRLCSQQAAMPARPPRRSVNDPLPLATGSTRCAGPAATAKYRCRMRRREIRAPVTSRRFRASRQEPRLACREGGRRPPAGRPRQGNRDDRTGLECPCCWSNRNGRASRYRCRPPP